MENQNTITPDLAQSDDEGGARGASLGVVVVIRLLVGLVAVGVAGLAGRRLAARVVGFDGEAGLDEGRLGVHVDGGEIVEDLVTIAGVLELKDAVLAAGGGHLDGDTAAVVVGLELLLVGATAAGDVLLITGAVVGRPQVDVLVHVVDDLDAAAAAAAAAGTGARAGRCAAGGGGTTLLDVGEGRSGHGEGAEEETVGEQHFE